MLNLYMLFVCPVCLVYPLGLTMRPSPPSQRVILPAKALRLIKLCFEHTGLAYKPREPAELCICAVMQPEASGWTPATVATRAMRKAASIYSR